MPASRRSATSGGELDVAVVRDDRAVQVESSRRRRRPGRRARSPRPAPRPAPPSGAGARRLAGGATSSDDPADDPVLAARPAQHESVARRDRDRAGQPEDRRRPIHRPGRSRRGRSGSARRRPTRFPGARGRASGRAAAGRGGPGADRSIATAGSSVRTQPAMELARVDAAEVDRDPSALGRSRRSRRAPGARGPGPSGRPGPAGATSRGRAARPGACRSRPRRGP